MSKPIQGGISPSRQREIAQLARGIVRVSRSERAVRSGGYDIDTAWRIAMRKGGSGSVVDLAIGGYAVPLERAKEIAPPSQTIPILARIPSGVVSILPGPYAAWRIVGRG